MNAILCPIVAHKLKHLENLAEMQALLIGNNVQGLIEIVSVLAIFRSGNVAGCIMVLPSLLRIMQGGISYSERSTMVMPLSIL